MLKVVNKSFEEIIKSIPEDAKVLDVGAAAAPTRRANYVIDIASYEQVRFNVAKGPGKIRFSSENYIQFDVCSREKWPFPDKFFDFSICSHLLEDVRDPLWVCSELIRVSKAGYIETPSRLYETSFGIEVKGLAGASHHHWIVEVVNDCLRFTFKYFFVHIPFVNRTPKQKMLKSNSILQILWDDNFLYEENWLADGRAIFEYYQGHNISDKEMWKIFRKTQDRNLVIKWLAYFKNTNKAARKIFDKFKK